MVCRKRRNAALHTKNQVDKGTFMLLITSFNEALFRQYGERMANEFEEVTDGSVKLVVVYEGNNLPGIFFKHVKFIKFNSNKHEIFKRKFGNLHEAKGLRIHFEKDGRVNLSLDYRFDALRFSFKVFSLLQIIAEIETPDNFAWIDADIRCLQNINSNLLLNFFPDENQLMSYLGRDIHPEGGPYSECGFLGFNNKHPRVLDFLNRMASIYVDGEIFTYEQWHDSWLWDQLRIEFENDGVKFKNISGEASKSEHPFINSGLGVYFDHLKGPKRKINGSSFIEDYKI